MVRLEPWQAALAALEGGERAVLIAVVSHSAHSPGTRGAAMTVLDDQVFGTIGGGIMEENAIQRARSLLGEPPHPPRRERLEHRERSDHPSGLFCSGEQTNLWLSLSPPDAPELAEALQRGEVFISSIGLTAAPVEGEWWERVCLVPVDRILIVGAGHCGQALARQMRILAWEVVLVDPRPSVSTVVSGEHITSISSYARVDEHLDPRTAAVVMTPSFQTDVEALVSLLNATDRPPFIGLMGSAAKEQRIRRRLAEIGLDLDEVHCPVGLEMRSETPEEIAVSVAGQLLHWAR